MKRRQIIIIVFIVIATISIASVVWLILQNRSQTTTESTPKTDNQKIVEVLAADDASATYELTPRSVVSTQKDGDWYLARVIFSSTSGSNETYPTILLKDSYGDFTIVVNIGDSLEREDLVAKSVPQSIVDTITKQSEPDDGQDHYE